MFENSCHDIDIKLYKASVEFADEEASSSTNFEQQVSEEFARKKQLQKDISAKREELEQVEEELPCDVCIKPSRVQVKSLEQWHRGLSIFVFGYSNWYITYM